MDDTVWAFTANARDTFQDMYDKYHFDRLDDKIVFIIDSIINELIDRPNILKFIQKNLSLGLYSEKLTDLLDSEELGIKELFVNEVKE